MHMPEAEQGTRDGHCLPLDRPGAAGSRRQAATGAGTRLAWNGAVESRLLRRRGSGGLAGAARSALGIDRVRLESVDRADRPTADRRASDYSVTAFPRPQDQLNDRSVANTDEVARDGWSYPTTAEGVQLRGAADANRRRAHHRGSRAACAIPRGLCRRGRASSRYTRMPRLCNHRRASGRSGFAKTSALRPTALSRRANLSSSLSHGGWTPAQRFLFHEPRATKPTGRARPDASASRRSGLEAVAIWAAVWVTKKQRA
jgi:hypothetical protein